MKNLEELIFDEYVQDDIIDLELNNLRVELNDAEVQLLATLSPEQSKLYSALKDAKNSFDVCNQVQLIQYVLSFIRNIFKSQ